MQAQQHKPTQSGQQHPPADTTDYSHKWYVMATVAMSVFLATIDGSIVNLALPTLVKDFQSDFAIVEWVVLGYLLTITTLLLSIGRLADIIGKKPVYITGVVVFTVGSMLCGVAPSVPWLIGFRVVQAFGAAMTMALGPAIITAAFPPTERGKALGVIGSVVSVGIVLGPTLGGVLISQLSWRWIFFVNLPVGIVGLMMAVRLLPADRPAGGQRFDVPGAITLFVCLLSLLLSLTFGQHIGFGSPPVLALFGNAALFLALFIFIEWKVRQPMIDLHLFRNSLIGANLIMGLISFVAAAGTLFLMPFYLENVLEYAPYQTGLLIAVIPIMLAVFSPLSGVLSDRFGTRPITVAGLVVLTATFYLLTTLDTNTSTLNYILLFLPLGIGAGMFQSPNNSAIMGTAPTSQLGVVSGLLAISRVLGQTIGIAVMGAVWAGRTFHHMGTTLEGGATAATERAQVLALHDTFLIAGLLLSGALLLGIWTWRQSTRQQARAALHP